MLRVVGFGVKSLLTEVPQLSLESSPTKLRVKGRDTYFAVGFVRMVLPLEVGEHWRWLRTLARDAREHQWPGVGFDVSTYCEVRYP